MASEVNMRNLSKKTKIIIGVVIALVFFAIIGFMTPDREETTQNNTSEPTAQTTGTLPTLNESEHTDKEGLVVFKDLTDKGYDVTAKYVNEKVSAANQDFTKQFKNADVNKCEDRLGYDAYIVEKVNQTGDKVELILGNEPTTSEACTQ